VNRSAALLRLLLLAPLACSSSGAAPPGPPVAGATDPAQELLRRLSGRFDSSAQAAADPEHFKAVQLHTCVVLAPELGPRVLYIEQAMLDQVRAPYRQRLYVIEPGPGGSVVSRVFELRDPGPSVGLCDAPTGPRRFAAAEVEEREGCRVELVRAGELYRGGTTGKACSSSLAGASYATSEVRVSAGTIESWDRGFDAGDHQVWGAQVGPYRFERRTPAEP